MDFQVPEVLIGANIFWKLHRYARKITRSLFAVNNTLGWCICGNVYENNARLSRSGDTSVFKVECSSFSDEKQIEALSNEILAKDLKCLWSLDSIGISCDKNIISEADQEIIENFEKQLKFKDGRYYTRLLWKGESTDKLGNNFENAKRQFDSLRNRLEKEKWVCDQYKQIINEQRSLGIVEECGRIEKEYFAPHREVVRTDKQTSQVRVVFNCSSKAKGYKSLNDCLLKGPSLTPLILDVINRFRMFKVAFTADIEKAFLMIGIEESDRNYLKFLWFDDDIQNYSILRMARVSFGCSCSPFILSATIKKHIKDYKDKNPDCYEMLNTSLFVDDLIYGSNNVDQAYELTTDASNILRAAGFRLRKFSTNSQKLQELWDQSDRDCFSDGNNDKSVIKILGMVWNKHEDTLSLELKSIVENLDMSICTKRYVLHTAAKFFDPIGIISPFLIRVKCLLQRLWERGIDWDQELPDDLRQGWERWCYEIKDLLELRVDRCYFTEVDYESPRVELHIFCDASPLAYGCIAYFKVVKDCRECLVSMVISKARVAPLKKLTLPRLELMGAVLAARIGKYISEVFKEIKFERFFWTDSTIVLHWLKGSAKEWKPFVQNRVIEIQTMSEPQSWSYCCTKENPADLLTRGVSAKVLINNKFWFRGPNWLSEVQGRCVEVDSAIKTENVDIERKKNAEKIIQFSCPIKTVEPVLNLENYSDVKRVFRITAWIKRFLNNANPKNERKRGSLSAEEINNAQTYWIKLTQELVFKEEMECLKGSKPVAKNSNLVEFSPFLDSEGVMRIGGRLQKSKFSFSQKHPILLPAKGKLVELLIWYAHEKVFHFGVNDTLVQLRELFWVIKGRQAVKSVIKKCIICRKYNARSGDQIIAPLPEDRITEQKPFCIVGLDFGGPVYVLKSDVKHYILLCTCAVTRAVHIELVDNLSTETFLLAFRRFVARRGLCHTIYSDNAKTFHRADLELRGIWKIINNSKVKDYYSCNRIKWKFIVEMSPWWGGFYERMVRSVKTALRKVVGKTTLTAVQLQTVITEIEATINSRPLTFVYSAAGEPAPITPSHFLIGERLTALPVVHMTRFTIPGSSDSCVKRYNLRERIMQHFWKRWRTEYLLHLRSAVKSHPSKFVEFSVNDVVLIHDEKFPRHMWKLGRVTEVYPGRDGKIRSYLLKTATGFVRRPTQLLYPLEIYKN